MIYYFENTLIRNIFIFNKTALSLAYYLCLDERAGGGVGLTRCIDIDIDR